MEAETRRFCEHAAACAEDASIRQLLDDLAAAETTHVERAAELEKSELKPEVREEEDKVKRPSVRVANCAAGSGRPDGRLGLDISSGLRCRFRHQEYVGCIRRRSGGFTGSGYQHGLCRGAIR